MRPRTAVPASCSAHGGRSRGGTVLALLLLGLASCGTTDRPAGDGRPAEQPPAATSVALVSLAPGFRFFAPTSVWNQPIPSDAPLAPESSAMVLALAAEVQREQIEALGPGIDTTSSSTSLYVVGPHQRTVRVQLSHPHLRWRAKLQAAFERVPIPSGAQPAPGPDRVMTVYQPATDRLWEFFHASDLADGWYAEWGGAMRHVSRSAGYYSPAAWPGATTHWGASATSLPLIGGVMLAAELQRGAIDHALAVSLPEPRKGVYAWPAQRSDGTGTSPADIPEGARLRLDPTLDIPALHLPHMTEMMALAAQTYGMIVQNQTHKGVAFYAEDPASVGHNPYEGPNGIYGGLTPVQLLAAFPWASLQVLAMQLHPVVE